MGQTQSVGSLGEELTARYLEANGYFIVDRNFRKPWGELDIVAKRAGIFHFVEVKSLSCETFDQTEAPLRPEDHMTPNKVKRLSRIIQTYIGQKVSSETWQFDLITVLINKESKKAKINHLKNLII